MSSVHLCRSLKGNIETAHHNHVFCSHRCRNICHVDCSILSLKECQCQTEKQVPMISILRVKYFKLMKLRNCLFLKELQEWMKGDGNAAMHWSRIRKPLPNNKYGEEGNMTRSGGGHFLTVLFESWNYKEVTIVQWCQTTGRFFRLLCWFEEIGKGLAG